MVIRIDGVVKARDASLVNPKLPTGEVEVFVRDVEVLGAAEELPLPVFGEAEYPEETRLKYRFLDLRREGLHAKIMLRAEVVAHLRDADAGAGLHRVPDADHHGLVARRGRGTSWCRRGCIRASSTRCRRRRSSSSS